MFIIAIKAHYNSNKGIIKWYYYDCYYIGSQSKSCSQVERDALMP